jgi:hypothetical protein
MLASNGNCESPTTNTTTYSVLLSLLSLTGLEVKSLWGRYVLRSGNGAGMKTLQWRETSTLVLSQRSCFVVSV